MERLATTQQSDFDSSRKVLSEFSTEEDQKLRIPAMADHEGDDNNKKKIAVKSDDGFVALNIAELVAATDHEWDPTASPRAPVVMNSFSRKGSQRSGGGGGGEAVTPSPVGGPSGRDKPPALGHVAVEGEAAGRHRPATPTAAGGRCRRAAGGRRPASWRDPRRVLFVFASLSCMGTLILLYFTLSMGRMTPR